MSFNVQWYLVIFSLSLSPYTWTRYATWEYSEMGILPLNVTSRFYDIQRLTKVSLWKWEQLLQIKWKRRHPEAEELWREPAGGFFASTGIEIRNELRKKSHRPRLCWRVNFVRSMSRLDEIYIREECNYNCSVRVNSIEPFVLVNNQHSRKVFPSLDLIGVARRQKDLFLRTCRDFLFSRIFASGVKLNVRVEFRSFKLTLTRRPLNGSRFSSNFEARKCFFFFRNFKVYLLNDELQIGRLLCAIRDYFLVN